MFEKGDRVRLKKEVTKEVLERWNSADAISHDDVYVVDRFVDDNKSIIVLKGIYYGYPAIFFETLRCEVEYIGLSLTSVLDLHASSFLDNYYIVKWEIYPDKVVVCYNHINNEDYILKVSGKTVKDAMNHLIYKLSQDWLIGGGLNG